MSRTHQGFAASASDISSPPTPVLPLRRLLGTRAPRLVSERGALATYDDDEGIGESVPAPAQYPVPSFAALLHSDWTAKRAPALPLMFPRAPGMGSGGPVAVN